MSTLSPHPHNDNDQWIREDPSFARRKALLLVVGMGLLACACLIPVWFCVQKQKNDSAYSQGINSPTLISVEKTKPVFHSPGLTRIGMLSLPDIPVKKQHDVLALVVRIIDGDTLIVAIPGFPSVAGNNISVRLAACDAPELTNMHPEIQERALEAKKRLTELAPPGSVVVLSDIKRGKYFRLIAQVEANGLNVAEVMLREGHVLPYAGGKRPTHAVTDPAPVSETVSQAVF